MGLRIKNQIIWIFIPAPHDHTGWHLWVLKLLLSPPIFVLIMRIVSSSSHHLIWLSLKLNFCETGRKKTVFLMRAPLLFLFISQPPNICCFPGPGFLPRVRTAANSSASRETFSAVMKNQPRWQHFGGLASQLIPVSNCVLPWRVEGRS